MKPRVDLLSRETVMKALGVQMRRLELGKDRFSAENEILRVAKLEIIGHDNKVL